MNLGLLVIRLVVGALLCGHGAQKLWGHFGGGGLEGTGAFFDEVGLRPGRSHAALAGMAELSGGVLLAFGLLTPLAAALVSAVMLTAIWTVHAPKGLWASAGGYEYNLVLLAAVFAVTAIGAGDWSLDHAIALHDAGVGWALAELGGGALASLAALTAVSLGRARHEAGDYGSPRPSH
jgi:putative oxidoreductase